MAIVKKVSRRFLRELGIGAINLTSDEHRIILMDDAFVFDPETHETLANVSASELPTGAGYTAQTKALVIDTAWAADTGTDIRALMTWEDILWSASTGDIGPTSSAIIYNHTHVSKIILGCIEFEVDVTIEDGLSFELRDLSYELWQKV